MTKLLKVFAAFAALLALSACGGGSESYFAGNDTVRRGVVTAETEAGTLSVSYLSSMSEGRRVVFLHGTPGDASAFYSLMRNAPADAEYVSVDRPGYGQTKPHKLVASLEAQADAIAPLLIEKDGKKPIVVGHSLGGPVAAMVGIRHADKIGGLVLVSASLDPELEPEPSFLQKLGNAPVISWFVPTDLIIINRELLALPKQLEAMRPELARITAPTLIVHGTADVLVPYGNVAYMEKHITGAKHLEVVGIQGMGHEVPWASAVMLSKAVRKLMDEDYNTATANVKLDRRHWVLGSQTAQELRDTNNWVED